MRLRRFFCQIQEISKKKIFTEIRRVFPAEIRNLKGFSGRNQVISKKKVLHRLWVSSRTKKLHYFGPNNGKTFTTSAPKSFWGGCFHFWCKNRPQKHKKRAIWHTFQSNGGGDRAPPGHTTGMEKNCQNEIWKNRLPFHSLPCPSYRYQAITSAAYILQKKNSTYPNFWLARKITTYEWQSGSNTLLLLLVSALGTPMWEAEV